MTTYIIKFVNKAPLVLTPRQKKQLVEVLSVVSYSKMARPWTKQTEIRILRDTIARAVFGISLTEAQGELFREALNMYLESLESMTQLVDKVIC